MKNLSHHTDNLCQLETSSLMRGIQIGDMSKLGWVIGLVKYAIWAVSLYFLYLLLLSVSIMLMIHIEFLELSCIYKSILCSLSCQKLTELCQM
jgi:hypothetical protein